MPTKCDEVEGAVKASEASNSVCGRCKASVEASNSMCGRYKASVEASNGMCGHAKLASKLATACVGTQS